MFDSISQMCILIKRYLCETNDTTEQFSSANLQQ